MFECRRVGFTPTGIKLNNGYSWFDCVYFASFFLCDGGLVVAVGIKPTLRDYESNLTSLV